MKSLHTLLLTGPVLAMAAMAGCDSSGHDDDRHYDRYTQNRDRDRYDHDRGDRYDRDRDGSSEYPRVTRLSSGNYLVNVRKGVLIPVDRQGRVANEKRYDGSDVRAAERAVERYEDRDSDRPRGRDDDRRYDRDNHDRDRDRYDRDRDDGRGSAEYPKVNRLSNGNYLVTVRKGVLIPVNRQGRVINEKRWSGSDVRAAERAVERYEDRH